MALEVVSETPPASTDAAPAATDVAPLSSEQRAKAAERARKSRAIKKLKGAKSEAQLKEMAAEVASSGTGEPEVSSWPSGEEIAKAAAEIGPALAQGAEFLKNTPWEVSDKQMQVLVLCLSPMAAQTAKNPGASALTKYVPPWLVALGGIAFVFGPPTVREIRAFTEGTPSPPKQKVPDAGT